MVNRLVLLPVLAAVLLGGCQNHRTRVSSTSDRPGVVTVVMKAVGSPNWSMPLHLVVQDSRGHRVGDAPLSDIPQGESFRLRASTRAASYAGLARAEALTWTGQRVIRVNYRGDVALFNRNLSDVQARRTRDAAGRRAWLVKFYDGQALRSSCAYAWRGQVLWAHVHLVPCAKTVLGAGKPQ